MSIKDQNHSEQMAQQVKKDHHSHYLKRENAQRKGIQYPGGFSFLQQGIRFAPCSWISFGATPSSLSLSLAA